MLKFNGIFRTGNSLYSRLRFSHNSNEVTKEKWDIFSSVSLERKPIITRDFNELEMKFHKLLLELEYARSHKSSFELRVEADKKRAQEFKEGTISISEAESFPQQTGLDFLDACTEELKSFKFASRRNEESIENNPKTLERALDRYLLLLVYEEIGKKSQWVLPQGKNIPGETLRQSAERILREKCGDNIRAQFFGNAPIGFYKYRYPLVVRTNESVGAKIFFYHAQVLGGEVQLNEEKCSDYMWATRKELDLLQSDYLKSIKMFLINEEL